MASVLLGLVAFLAIAGLAVWVTGAVLQASCAVSDVRVPSFGKALGIVIAAAFASTITSVAWGLTGGLFLAWMVSTWVAAASTWLVSLLAVGTTLSATLRVSLGRGMVVALAYRAMWLVLGGVAWLIHGLIL